MRPANIKILKKYNIKHDQLYSYFRIHNFLRQGGQVICYLYVIFDPDNFLYFSNSCIMFYGVFCKAWSISIQAGKGKICSSQSQMLLKLTNVKLQDKLKSAYFFVLPKKIPRPRYRVPKMASRAPFFVSDFLQNFKMVISLEWLKILCCCLFYLKDNNVLKSMQSFICKYMCKFSCCSLLKFYFKNLKIKKTQKGHFLKF